MMRELLKVFIILVVVGFCLPIAQAFAIPSPVPHLHTAKTVHWKETGSPNLPWKNPVANQWNHNHLTKDQFNNAPDFVINKAWDNRVLHSSLAGQAHYGHGMIMPGSAVRYGWTGDVPGDAKTVVESAFNSWITDSTAQFNNHKDPWDRLAIDFDRADKGTFEITIDFDPNLNAYGETVGSTITFLTTPNPTFDFPAINEIFDLGIANPAGWDMRFGDSGAWADVLGYNAIWSFDGSPETVFDDQDIDFKDPGGTIYDSLNGLDTVDLTEMDFATIALHEIGHVIGLGHPGDPTTSIMRTHIYRNAIFGSAMSIDDSSALGVAIDYTYAVPEPCTIVMIISGFLGIAGIARRRPRLKA